MNKHFIWSQIMVEHHSKKILGQISDKSTQKVRNELKYGIVNLYLYRPPYQAVFFLEAEIYST